jgi:hypothetical protein
MNSPAQRDVATSTAVAERSTDRRRSWVRPTNPYRRRSDPHDSANASTGCSTNDLSTTAIHLTHAGRDLPGACPHTEWPISVLSTPRRPLTTQEHRSVFARTWRWSRLARRWSRPGCRSPWCRRTAQVTKRPRRTFGSADSWRFRRGASVYPGVYSDTANRRTDGKRRCEWTPGQIKLRSGGLDLRGESLCERDAVMPGFR